MAVNFQPIYILASGGSRAVDQLDTITNNISNANTSGFKKILMREMSQKIPENVGQTGDLLVFPRFRDTHVINSQGTLIKTDNPLDLAIEGEGFFQVETNVGRFYTRNGHLFINNEGFLVDQNGGYVLDTNEQRIKLNTNGRIDITTKGEIYQNGQLVATLRVVNLQNLQPVGNSYYNGQEQPTQKYSIRQGFLEGSNINIVKEMVEMINSHRRFDIYMNLAKSLDQLEGRLNEIGKA
ncbi:flagellar hook-basal body protein [Sulfurihydrogenibium subterraneum]|uniref:flagellar hook-basal body protein n=1 Tax=Sulfurihydrogenibium subterraneum TaxID=171121 RepID=UPI00048BA0BF|nr:flagellar hook basal-body protein [Sulfurihydrogenibium subterraneum]